MSPISEGKGWKDLDFTEWLKYVVVPVGGLLIAGFTAYTNYDLTKKKELKEELRYNQERQERKLRLDMERDVHKIKMEEHLWEMEDRMKRKEIKTKDDSLKIKK